jgi:hypothetical protein
MSELSNENWISNRLEEQKMKPKLGRKVYCIYETGIMVDCVGYVGKDSFIVESYGLSTVPSSWEWDYDLYGEKWFTSLSKAKKKLIDMYKDKYENKLKIVKIADDWYALEFC